MIGFKSGTSSTSDQYNTIQYGVACQGNLNNPTASCFGDSNYHDGGDLGSFTSDTVFEVRVVGNSYTVRKDGVEMCSHTKSVTYPLHVFADVHDANPAAFTQVVYIAAE